MKTKLQFIENVSQNKIPSYDEAVELCLYEGSPFYETKLTVSGYNVSVFNYRLAQSSDFTNPIPEKPELKGYELRGLTFVFNLDGTLYKRYVLLEKFFNLNQTAESLYSVVKDYKIKYINNKEDGSIATFIKLPNGEIVGKTKMGFDNDQATGINRIYKTNKEVNSFVNWCLNLDIVPIFEFVAPSNRIVLRYLTDELILLRLRDIKTGKHIDIREHLDKIGSIRIAPFEDDVKDLDHLIELTATQVDKEGSIVTCVDEFGRDFFFKIKTPWYCERHGLLTEDIYRENLIIGYILDDKIDDVLGQVPEDEVEAHFRIKKIISIIKKAISEKEREILRDWDIFVNSNLTRKEYVFSELKTDNFPFVMNLLKVKELKEMSWEEILDIYETPERYEMTLAKCDSYEMSKEFIREKTKRLQIARDWLSEKDETLFFKDGVESEDGD